jgi:ElaA protein
VSGADAPIVYADAPVSDIDPVVLYRMLQLRVEVFVVEQGAAYPELDGRDIEPGARMVWAQVGDEVVATLRVLQDAAGLRIGRVVAAGSVRGTPVASDLMRRGLEVCAQIDPTASIALDAQSALEGWYARFGFTVDGAPFEEDGIPHVPMSRPGA